MIRLRAARPADGDRVVEIWRRAVEATHDFLSREDREAIAAEVAHFLPAAPLTLAVDEADRPLAFMLVDRDMVEALFVDPAHHGRGIGRLLMRAAAQGHARLRVDVNEGNGQALAFYRRLGFAQVGRSEVDGQGRPYPLLHLEADTAGL